MSDATAADTTTSQAQTTDVATTTQAGETSVLGGAVADGATQTGAQETTTSETTTDTAQAAAETVAAPIVPEKYELALEGLTLDAGLVDAADPVLRELGLSNDQANSLLPLAQQIQQRTTDALVQQLADAGAAQKREWFDAFVADLEIGGANREQSEHLAARGLDALGFTKEHPFRTALTESGFGNHPDMIRAFRAIGQMVGEDGTFARAGAGSDSRPVWERLYPNDAQR